MQTTLHRHLYDLRHDEFSSHDSHESVATLVITAAGLMMLAGLALFFFRLFPATTPEAIEAPVNEINAELPAPGQAMDGTRL